MASTRKRLAYGMLLLAQTAATSVLFLIVFPIFYELATHLGTRQDLAAEDQISIVICACVLHGCYWTRLLWVDVMVPFHNRFLAHLVLFASRVSFFFGGAFFSAVFFRHLPALEALPPLGQTAVKAVYLAAVLFGLFCYSLELERLGKAIDGPSPPA
jgi:hypothetical protein